MVTNINVTIPCLDEQSYQGVIRALHKPRHSYLYGDLQLPAKFMNVSWDAYRQFLDALGDKHVRHYYNQGTLEIMSPLKSHEWIKKLIGRLIEMMTWDQDIAIQSVGSMTVTSELEERGFEPDESYYIANEPKVRCKMHFEPDVDPPPDLVVEVDVTRKSKAKLELFAAMKVPEVWLHDTEKLSFLVRSRSGVYKESRHSKAFPFLTPDDVSRFVDLHGEKGENELVTSFLKWVRKCRKERSL